MYRLIRVYLFLVVNVGFAIAVFDIPSYAYQIIDCLLFLFLFYYFFSEAISNGLTKLEFFPLILFVFVFVYVFIYSYANELNILDALSYTVVLFRSYVLCVFGLVLIRINKELGFQSNKLISDMNVYLVFNFFIVLIQFLYPSFGRMFIPVISEKQSSFLALELDGDASGCFANTIELAYFSLVVVILNLIQSKNNFPILIVMVGLVNVYLSGSLATFFVFVFVLAAFILKDKIIGKIYLSLFLFVLLILYYGVLNSIVLRTIDNMYLSRLGLLFNVFPHWVSLDFSNLFFGNMPDFSNLANTFYLLDNRLAIFDELNTGTVINDTFWLALVFSYGLPITCLLIIGYFFCMKEILMQSVSSFGSLYKIILLSIFILGCFNQVLLVRVFSIPFVFGLISLALSENKSYSYDK